MKLLITGVKYTIGNNVEIVLEDKHNVEYGIDCVCFLKANLKAILEVEDLRDALGRWVDIYYNPKNKQWVLKAKPNRDLIIHNFGHEYFYL